MSSELEPSRFTLELELLQAMYPENLTFDPRSRDLKFSDGAALLHLRIPESYPDAGLPEVLEARDTRKNDVQDRLKTELREMQSEGEVGEGEEVLDAVLGRFQALVDGTKGEVDGEGVVSGSQEKHEAREKNETDKTVIIWLHHLLALSKRKLAVSPASPLVRGITKPGYPGVMVFSGPAAAVSEHVETLKRENWQAFQVRLEEDVGWVFGHSEGVVEVESMSEVVKEVEVGKGQREEFLRAVGIK